MQRKVNEYTVMHERDSSNLSLFNQISYSLPHFNFIRYCQLSQYPYPKPQLSPNPTSSKNSIGSKRGSPLKFWREGGHPPPLRRTTSMKLVAHLSSQYTSIQEGQIQDLKDMGEQSNNIFFIFKSSINSYFFPQYLQKTKLEKR